MTPSARPRWSLKSVPASGYVFLAIFLLRLIVLVRLTESPFLLPDSGDMQFYNEWARRILGGQWTDHHAFYGLPLYPYLLAFLYKLCGFNPFLPGLLQALFEGGTGALIYKFAVKIFGAGASASPHRGQIIGTFAALGYGFFLPAQAYAVILMPAAGLVFVFWFVVWQIVRLREMPGSGWVLLLGAFIGFTAMGVATILFVSPLLLAAFIFKWPAAWRARLLASALLFLGIGAGTAPCWVHNYFVAKDPVFLSAHSGVNFWIGNNPDATGYPRFPPGLHAGQEAMLKDSITGAEREAGHPLKRSEVSAYWSAKAKDYIGKNFGAWLKLLGIKVANFWNAFQYDDLSVITTLREEGVLLPGMKFGLVAALGLPGLLLAWRKYPLSRWVAGAVALHLISLLSVFVTERYRLAVVPGLSLFAAAGLWEFWSATVTAQYRRGALYLGLLGLSTWFVSIPKQEPSLWALDSYNSGLRALHLNRLVIAEEKLDLAYAYAPKNAELNFALGNLRLAQGNTTAAKGFYLAVLQLDPRHEGSYNNLGVLALGEKRWALAIKFFSRALEEDPLDPKTYYVLAQAHFQAGDLTNALKMISRAIELDPRQPEFPVLRDEIEGKLRAAGADH